MRKPKRRRSFEGARTKGVGTMMTGFGFEGFGAFGWIGMILNWVITIGLIVGVVLLIAWLVKRIDANGQAAKAAPTAAAPREIAQISYAHGQITREQYQQLVADLGQ